MAHADLAEHADSGKTSFRSGSTPQFPAEPWTPDLRLALLLCIPGVVVAIALRLWLSCHMPYGFVHGDTAQQLSTALTFIDKGSLY